MRGVLVAIALAGCAAHNAPGPAWPGAKLTDSDGGESLAPHEPHQLAKVIEKSDDDAKPTVPALVPTSVGPAIDTVGPVVAPAVSAPIEEMITSEDIIIEIDD